MIRFRIVWYMIRYPLKFLYAIMEGDRTRNYKIDHKWLDKIRGKP